MRGIPSGWFLVTSLGLFVLFFLWVASVVVVVLVSSRGPSFVALCARSNQRPLIPHFAALAYPAAPSRTQHAAQRHYRTAVAEPGTESAMRTPDMIARWQQSRLGTAGGEQTTASVAETDTEAPRSTPAMEQVP